MVNNENMRSCKTCARGCEILPVSALGHTRYAACPGNGRFGHVCMTNCGSYLTSEEMAARKGKATCQLNFSVN